MFSLVGVWLLIKRKVTMLQAKNLLFSYPVTWIFAAYSIIHVALTAYHRDPRSAYGNIVPFVLFPLILVAFMHISPSHKSFWRGAAVGALVALVIATYQIYALKVDRALGFRHPILFGNTAVVLGTAALIGWISCKTAFRDAVSRLILIAGGIAGLLASLLSGSKGGWMSLLMVIFFITLQATKEFDWKKKICTIVLVLTALTCIVAFSPRLVVIDRIVSAFHGTVTWVKTGEVTEYSASSRLESFKAGILAGSQSPIIGLGSSGQFEAIQKAIDNGSINPKFLDYKVIDNDFISLFATKGVIGVLAALAVHLGLFFTFFKHRNDSSESVRALATMGMLLVMLYVEFGLSVSIFGTNIFRMMYISWTMILAGLIMVEKRNFETSLGPVT